MMLSMKNRIPANTRFDDNFEQNAQNLLQLVQPKVEERKAQIKQQWFKKDLPSQGHDNTNPWDDASFGSDEISKIINYLKAEESPRKLHTNDLPLRKKALERLNSQLFGSSKDAIEPVEALCQRSISLSPQDILYDHLGVPRLAVRTTCTLRIVPEAVSHISVRFCLVATFSHFWRRCSCPATPVV